MDRVLDEKAGDGLCSKRVGWQVFSWDFGFSMGCFSLLLL